MIKVLILLAVFGLAGCDELDPNCDPLSEILEGS